MLSDADAKDEIKTLFSDYWNTQTTALNIRTRKNRVYVPRVYWPDIEIKDHKNSEESHCKVLINNTITQQSSMKGGRDELIGTKYETVGIIVVELFFSTLSNKTADKKALKDIAFKAFISKSTPNGVWFRNTTIVDVESTESWFRTNIISEYLFSSEI